MSLRNTSWLLSALALACGTQSPAAPSSPGSVEHIVAVEPDPAQRRGVVLLQFLAEPEHMGAEFAVVDEAGYCGLVRVTRKSRVDCDHCPGPLIEAQLLSGRGPSGNGSVALGPVQGPLPKARIGRVPRTRSPTSEWRVTLQVDLDGDGSWDLLEKERCGHSVPSGCAGAADVCDMFCTGVSSSGSDPDPAAMHCRSVVPDLEDCAP